jgi:hypothetical protein
MANPKLVIAGDIGGTNSRLQVRSALCSAHAVHVHRRLIPNQLWNLELTHAVLLFEKIYSSSAFDSMHELLQAFVADAGYSCCAAVLPLAPLCSCGGFFSLYLSGHRLLYCVLQLELLAPSSMSASCASIASIRTLQLTAAQGRPSSCEPASNHVES